jgi:hypothetical protein
MNTGKSLEMLVLRLLYVVGATKWDSAFGERDFGGSDGRDRVDILSLSMSAAVLKRTVSREFVWKLEGSSTEAVTATNRRIF